MHLCVLQCGPKIHDKDLVFLYCYRCRQSVIGLYKTIFVNNGTFVTQKDMKSLKDVDPCVLDISL